MTQKAVYALAVSPHPFDNELGIAGTVAHWTREGKEVVYVICTNGDKGTADPKWLPEEFARVREQEQLAAAKLLGVKEVIFLRHPDLGLEYTPEFRKEILRLVLMYRPEVVLTCDPYQRFKGYFSSIDHRVTGQATLDVVWPFALIPNACRDLMAQGYQPHRVKQVMLWGSEQPNTWYDITDTFEIKKKAFFCNKSQTHDPPLPQFAQRMTERAETAAKGKDFKLGEAFHLVEAPQGL